MKNMVSFYSNSCKYRKLLKFTLVELLVVIGILSILFAMLLPALQVAKEQGRSIFCVNNIRQMSQAAIVYTVTYDGYFPIACGTVASGLAWDVKVVGIAPNQTFEPGLLWESVNISSNSNAIHQCPSFHGADMWGGESYTGYNYNTTYIGCYDPNNNINTAKNSIIKNPSETAIFGDAAYEGGINANKFMRSPLDDFTLRSAGTQHFRHLGAANTSFVDGHATNLYKCFRNSNANVYGLCGWISEDDSLYDLK